MGKRWMSAEDVTGYALGFVAAWFGVHEIISPRDWTVFAPTFLIGSATNAAVIVHGLLLTAVALFLVLDFHRRLGAALFALLLTEIILNLIVEGGLSDIAVRDIGLWGAAVALLMFVKGPKTGAPGKN